MRTRLTVVLLFLFVLQTSPATAYESANFESAGVTLRYYSAGSGEPVILLHGFSGSANTAWIEPGIFNALVDGGLSVIAIDHRGHGGSDKPHDASAYGTTMAEDVGRLLDHLKIEKAHIVGYSMGAKIANTFRDLHPTRLITLTLGGYGWPWRSAPVTLEDARKRLANRSVMPGNDLDALAAYSVYANQLIPDEASLKSNRVPTLSLVGTEDEVVSRQSLDTLRKTMSHVRSVDMPGTHAGPDGALYKPQFAAEVLQFIRSNRR